MAGIPDVTESLAEQADESAQVSRSLTAQANHQQELMDQIRAPQHTLSDRSGAVAGKMLRFVLHHPGYLGRGEAAESARHHWVLRMAFNPYQTMAVCARHSPPRKQYNYRLYNEQRHQDEEATPNAGANGKKADSPD